MKKNLSDKKSTSKAEQSQQPGVAVCRDMLLAAVHHGDFPLEKRLRVAEVAARFGVTQAVVQAVFKELVTTGIMYRKERSGTYLRKISTREMMDSSLVRAWLEALAAGLASQRLTAAELEELDVMAVELDALGAEARARPLEPARYVSQEVAFHEKVVQASGNTVLCGMAERERFILRYIEQHARLRLILPRPRVANPTHGEVVAALRSRDAARAQEVMYRHVVVWEVAKATPWLWGDEQQATAADGGAQGQGLT